MVRAVAAGPAYTRLEASERRAQIVAAARRLFAERPWGTVSTTAIAREAGVTRGLLHHHFGTRRELELEVVRAMVRVPPPPLPADVAGRSLEDVIGESFERWLRLIDRNRGTWMASVGAGGPGAGADVEAILEEAREQAVDRLLAVLAQFGHADTPARRATLRAFGAFAETATLEWLRRERLTRSQLAHLLRTTFLHLTSVTPSSEEP
jgi:AcrR family transcriptional regulator